MERKDPFPTRLEEKQPHFSRIDPIVHSRNEDRWEGPLAEESLSRYERDGFLWFKGFFSRERVEPFFDELRELGENKKQRKGEHIIADPDSGEIRSVFAMHRISKLFDKLTRDPRILGMVRQLLGSDVYIHQSRINDKFGFQGSGFNWHSDFETWHAEDGMPRMRAVSASLMLTDNSEFNGPLMLIPGSHHYFVPCVGTTPDDNWKKSLKQQRAGVPDQESLQKLADQGGIEAPKGPPGSLLLFECNTLHASNKNLSPWPRSNLFFVYNSIENMIDEPYAAKEPRPEFLATRDGVEVLDIEDHWEPIGH